MRRDAGTTALLALALTSTVPAYDRVFETAGWRGPALLAAAAALLLATVVRRVGRGPWVAAGVSLLCFLALAPWLLGIASRPTVPGPETLELLGEVLRAGGVELAQTPAPAPPTSGLLLLTIGGWWLVAHVAHEVALRWRRPGLALVVLTVLWATPLAVPMADGTSWPRVLPFLAAGGAMLLLGPAPDGTDEPAPVTAGGLALGGLALLVGFTLPGTLPGFAEPAWVPLGQGVTPRGYQPIVDVSQRLGSPQERDLLRVRASQRTYLRLAGLESFDGDVWRLGPAREGSYRPDPTSLYPADAPLPAEQPMGRSEPVQVDVEVLELENIYVPVPYQPVEILGPVRDEMVWSTEGGFLATWDTAAGEAQGEPRIGVREGVEYRVLASRPAPTFDELSSATGHDETTLERFTALPRAYPDLGAQAEAVYEAAGATTDVERALALQDWFVGPEGGFTYDLGVPALRGEDALTDFVLDDRVGYCEYFATAMAVMLRQTGVPARVATGFLPGRVTEPADPAEGRELTEFTVSTSDAHAWVEVLFPGSGWITFDPTPRDDETQVPPTSDDLAPIENIAERREQEAELEDETETDAGADDGTGTTGDDALDQLEGSDADTGGGRPTVGIPSLLALGLVLAAGGGALLLAARRRREDGPGRSPQQRVLHAQRGLLSVAARHGVPRREHETTAEVVDRWRSEHRIDDRGSAVAVLAQNAAFGGQVDQHDANEAERLVAEVEQMLRSSVTSRDRAFAPLRLPAASLARHGRRLLDAVRRWRSD